MSIAIGGKQDAQAGMHVSSQQGLGLVLSSQEHVPPQETREMESREPQAQATYL